MQIWHPSKTISTFERPSVLIVPLFSEFLLEHRQSFRISSSVCCAATLRNECPSMSSSIMRFFSVIRLRSNKHKRQVSNLATNLLKPFLTSGFSPSADLPSPFTPSQKSNIAANTAPSAPSNNNNINNNVKIGELSASP